MSEQDQLSELLKYVPGFLRKPLLGLSATAAVAAILLGTLSTVLGHITDIRDHLLKLVGVRMSGAIDMAMEVFAILLVVLGVAVLYLKYARPRASSWSKSRRNGVVLAFFLLAFASAAVMYSLFPQPPSMSAFLEKESQIWTSRLWSAQRNSEEHDEVSNQSAAAGGLRFSLADTAASSQVFSSAQSVVAVMAASQPSSQDVENALRAIEYIESVRLKPVAGAFANINLGCEGEQGNSGVFSRSLYAGWGYMQEWSWGVTEIIAWVVLAKIAVVRSTTSAAAELRTMKGGITRLKEDLELLISRQNDTGAWTTISVSAEASHQRMYSTLIATWALIEASESSAFSTEDREKYHQAAIQGITWMINAHSEVHGWAPNPARKDSEHYPGLNAQILFVLTRAARFGFFDNTYILSDSRYVRAVRGFEKSVIGQAGSNIGFDELASINVSENKRSHDSDRYLAGTPFAAESMTFLWYPWALALAVELVNNEKRENAPDLRSVEMLEVLLQRGHHIPDFLMRDGYTYVTAENLFAVNTYLNQQRSEKSRIASKL